MRRIVFLIAGICLYCVAQSQLAAHYRFKNNALDQSGNNNNGTPVNGPAVVNDRFNKPAGAYYFDGTNQYINVPHSTSLQLTGTVSVTAWVKRNSNNAVDILIEKGGDWTTGTCNYGIGLHNNFNFMFYFYYNGGFRGVDGVSDFNWHHYAVVATNGNANPLMFIDGTQRTVIHSGGSAAINLFASTDPLHIGAQLGPFTYFSHNTVDELKIYNGGLTSQQILDDYILTAPPGTTTYNRSVLMNGINDYIPIGNLGAMPNEGTITFWMQTNVIANYPNTMTTGDLSGCSNGNNAIRFEQGSNVFGLSVSGSGTGCTTGGDIFSNNIQTNAIYHIALTWNKPGNNIKGYLDGVQIFSTAITIWPTDFFATKLGVGWDATRKWNGSLDEFTFWNKILTPAEITAVIQNNFSPEDPNLYAYYNFDNNNVNGENQTVVNIVNPGTNNGITIGTASTPVFVLGLNLAPTSITAQPVNQTGCLGGNVTFSVTASGAQLTYQWRKAGVNITGANSPSYTINNISTGDAGSYDVIVSGLNGSVTSAPATLTIGNIVINTQPVSQTVCPGTNITLSVAANGAGTLMYQWKKNGVNINGATLPNYTITNVSPADGGNYIVDISGTCGTVSSGTAILTVNTVTTINGQPISQVVCSGGTASFSVTAAGTSLTYQWKKNGADIPGAISSTYTINPVTPSDAGNYTVVVSGNCGTETSSAATLTINDITSIITQPTNQSACPGASVSFSVTANGSGTLSYQWKKNGTDIPGAISSTYTINPVTAGDAGNYSVVVTGACGSITSATATLTISAGTTITTQPSGQSVCVGATASFSVTASGSGTLTYQWKKNGTNIPGATTSVYSITSVTPADAADYTVEVSSSCGTVLSNTATLSIIPSTAISAQPTAQAVCAGSNATFTVVASGAGLSYQWRKNGSNINGATASSYTINNVIAGDAGNYDVVVSGTCGTVTSVSVALSLTNVIIGTQPSSQTLCAGAIAAFNVSATGGGTLTYQWKKNGVNIPGATSSTYTINPVTTGDAGNYTVDVINNCGTAGSNTAVLTVNALTAIGNQPASQLACLGSNVSFNVVASGSNLSYQWRKNGANIPGAIAASYTISNIAAGDAANYDVVITGTCGTVTSNSASLSITPAPSINTQPLSQTVFTGNPVSFSVAATGSGLSYQWRKNGTNIPGATGTTYTISNVTVTDAGNYEVVVSGTCSPAAVSAVAILTVNTVTISAQPVSQSVCTGVDATFSVSANGVNITYQWQLSAGGSAFTNITGATSSSLSLNAVTIALSGNQYRCVLSGILNSAAATLIVNPLPSVRLNLPFDTLYLNSPLQTLTGGTPSGGLFTGAGISGGTFLPGSLGLGHYTLTYRYTDINGCSASAQDRFTIIPKAEKINLYPNPVRNGKFSLVVSPDLVGCMAVVFNSAGQKIAEFFVGGRLTRHEHPWGSGQYTILLIKGGVKVSKKFILIR